jgi:hypothetical protein
MEATDGVEFRELGFWAKFKIFPLANPMNNVNPAKGRENDYSGSPQS